MFCFPSYHPIYQIPTGILQDSTTDYTFLCIRALTLCPSHFSPSSRVFFPSSECFPESDSSPQIQGWDFFTQGRLPYGVTVPGIWLWDRKAPEEIWSSFFWLKLWFMRNSWTDYVRFHLNRFEGHVCLLICETYTLHMCQSPFPTVPVFQLTCDSHALSALHIQ